LISLSNPNNAFVALAQLRNNPFFLSPRDPFNTGAGNGKGKARATNLHSSGLTATDLKILEGVDRLLALPVPGSSGKKGNLKALGGRSNKTRLLDTVNEEDEAEDQSDPATEEEEDTQVDLMQGFLATAPAAAKRKVARRRRRAGISERALGLPTDNGTSRRRSVLPPSAGGRLSLLPEGEFAVESIESTPRRRVIRAKRRSSFMPGAPAQQQQDDADLLAEEQLTKPELEQELKEIGLDKDALAVKRRLVIKDLEELEARIQRLEGIKQELGTRLLDLKEEELELDDECRCPHEILIRDS
jgi:hypothetical protein